MIPPQAASFSAIPVAWGGSAPPHPTHLAGEEGTCSTLKIRTGWGSHDFPLSSVSKSLTEPPVQAAVGIVARAGAGHEIRATLTAGGDWLCRFLLSGFSVLLHVINPVNIMKAVSQ